MCFGEMFVYCCCIVVVYCCCIIAVLCFLLIYWGGGQGGSRISSSLDWTNKIVLNKEARKDRNFTAPTLYQFKK